MRDRGLDRASVLAYYSIFSLFSFLVLGSYLFSRIFVKTEGEVLNSFFFTREFFRKVPSLFFERARTTAEELGNISVITAVIFVLLGFMLLKKLVQYINEMFESEPGRGFFMLRLKEFLLLILVIMMLFLTFVLNALVMFFKSNVYEKTIIRDYINPRFIATIDNIFLHYFLPLILAVLFFFILFKVIPEVIVRKRSALKAAIVCSLLWEVIKRVYSYYLVNYSLLGKVNNMIVSLIILGFWMEIVMGIILFGAKLTWTLDQGR